MSVLVVIGAVGLLAGCDNSGSSNTSAQKMQRSNSSANAPVQNNPRNPWPYLKDGNSTDFSMDGMTTQNFMVVFDGSGSMDDRGCSGRLSKSDAAKNALAEFAKSVPGDANLGLVVFDSKGIFEATPLSKGQRQSFVKNIMQVRPEGGTPLRDSIKMAYQQLSKQGRAQLGYGEYHLVIVTDGQASPGQGPEDIVSQILRESPVVIHTIGFCINKNHSLNQPGKTLYRTANDVASLKKGLQGVLAEAPEFIASDFN